MSDLVSIIMPTYNSEEFISRSIESIIDQTYENWELLITDDCSNDRTTELIKDYTNDQRIKLFKLNVNSGAGIARNKSISESSGRYIAFCDSDDLWLPYKLEKQLSFLLSNKLSFTYSSFEVINENGDLIKTVNSLPFINYKIMLRNNYVGCLTAIYDTHFFGKVYMSSIRRRQDWVLWLTLLKKIDKTIGIQEPLAQYTYRKNSISSHGGSLINKLKLLRYNWNVYRGEMKYSFIRSSFLITNFMIYYVIKNSR